MVIGGGAAGISCACELAERGAEVVLLEAGDDLGGRARSRWDDEAGMRLDNSQHVILGCCSETIALLFRLNTVGLVRFHDTVHFRDKSGSALKICSSLLPTPLHTLPSLLRTDYISRPEKVALVRTLARMRLCPPDEDATASGYLKSLGCPEGLLERVIEPIIVSALNEEADVASAAYARIVLLKSLVESRDGYHLGVPVVPLSELIATPAKRYLAEQSCEVRLSTKVRELNVEGGGVVSVSTARGEEVRADAYVCAVTPASLRALGYETEACRELSWHSIVSVHLFFEEEIAGLDQVCLVDEPFQWVFNKTIPGMGFGYVQAVASAADGIANAPMTTVANLALKAAGKAAPETRGMPVRRSLVYRGTRATFATAGADRLRPGCKTDVGNLYLAGDWTDTGWPATIESAVRSGCAAARAVMG